MVKPGPGSIPREVRALCMGLLLGVGGAPLDYKSISSLIKERFGLDISPRTLKNWPPKLPDMMKKYGITHAYIEEVVLRLMAGKKPDSAGIRKVTSDEIVEEEKKSLSESKPSEGPLTFNSIADVMSYMEGQGFVVGKSVSDLISILEANGLRVFDKEQSIFGVENLFIEPIELDIEAVGRNITGNPVIMLYFALERRKQEDLDLAEWITSCIVNIYNPRECPHCGYITKGVRMAVLFG